MLRDGDWLSLNGSTGEVIFQINQAPKIMIELTPFLP